MEDMSEDADTWTTVTGPKGTLKKGEFDLFPEEREGQRS